MKYPVMPIKNLQKMEKPPKYRVLAKIEKPRFRGIYDRICSPDRYLPQGKKQIHNGKG